MKKQVEKDQLKINNIVLELDLHTLSGKFNEPQWRFFLTLEFNDDASLKNRSELRGQPLWSMLVEKYFPVMGNGISMVESIVGRPKLTMLYSGWEKHTGDFSQEENRTKIAYENYDYYFSEEQPRIDEESFLYLLKMITYAKENDIGVIFIKYPVAKEYDEMIMANHVTKDDYYTTIFSHVDTILGKKNYVVLDYYGLFFDKPEYLNDNNHLNAVGAEIFSKKVNADLETLDSSKTN